MSGSVTFSPELSLKSTAAYFKPIPLTYSALKDLDGVWLPSFAVDSTRLVQCGCGHRRDFKKKVLPPAPIVSASDFVPKVLIEHLMRNKKNSALSIKYLKGDEITNFEGALHTYVTPIGVITLSGDYVYEGYHSIKKFGDGKGRQAVLSAAIHPDFENEEVMLQVAGLRDVAIAGEKIEEAKFQIPSAKRKKNDELRTQYDSSLLKHLIYHLTSEHSLPSTHECSFVDLDFLESLIKSDVDIFSEVQNKAIELNYYALSVEILLNSYIHQLRNEFSVLEQCCPNGYVYTISPPRIFAAEIGTSNVIFLNRLQTLAFKVLLQSSEFRNLKIIAFCDAGDHDNIEMLENVFADKGVKVISRSALFSGEDETYNGPEGLTLVLHNNSDAFGQNIETEGPSSLDGIIGSYSDAAWMLKRDRDDLLDIII